MIFHPPESGLKPGENVVWARKKATGYFIIWCSGMLGIGGTLAIVFAFSFVGMTLGVPLLGLVLLGFLFIERAFIKERGTMYYLTNERLIEARKGRIVHEVSLKRFEDKPLNQFFEKRVLGYSNQQPVYAIKIYDPLSGNILMEFKDLDENSVKALESIGQTVECSYCGYRNPVNSLKCRNCGAPL